MLISETHLTKKSNFYTPERTLYFTSHADGKAHGGTAVLATNSLNHRFLHSYATICLQSTSITLKALPWPHFLIAEKQFSDFFIALGNKLLPGGD